MLLGSRARSTGKLGKERETMNKRAIVTWSLTGALVLSLAIAGIALSRAGASAGTSHANAVLTPTASVQQALKEGFDLGETPAPDFTLKDQHGASVSLAQLRGHPVVLTFFDSVCPHADCSVMAQYLDATAADLGPQTADVEWVALSVDPWHDTPATASGFLTSRQVTWPFHYLLGTPEQMKPLWDAYHMQAILQSDSIVIHTTGVYVIDAQGRERLFFEEGFDPPVLSAYLKYLLKGSGAAADATASTGGSTAGIVTQHTTVNGTTIDLTATPGRFGTYSYMIALGNAQGTPVQGATVSLHLTMPDMEMEPVDVTLAPLNPPIPGSYEATGVLSMAGQWQAVVQVQIPGTAPVQATFSYTTVY